MKKTILIAVMTGALAVSGFGATVNQRQVNQQRRIGQGVTSGQLTPRETARLETREARVNREVRHDRRADNGHLTAAEHRQVNRQQNRLSNSIYRDKHNAAQR